MATERGIQRSTPGVYIDEPDSFPPSIVGVATAAPIFIGYTQFAGDPGTGAALYLKPVPIASMGEFVACFGGAPPWAFNVAPVSSSVASDTLSLATFDAQIGAADGTTSTARMSINVSGNSARSRFLLYHQMKLFFANGGGQCFVVSVGSYWMDRLPAAVPSPTIGWEVDAVDAQRLCAGLEAARAQAGPTMIVVPEAALLADVGAGTDYSDVVTAMLRQAGDLKDRMAILDLPDSLAVDTLEELTAAQAAFWRATAPALDSVGYGAAYAPALNTSVIAAAEISCRDLAANASAANETINNILTTQALALHGGEPEGLVSLRSMIALRFPPRAGSSAPCSTDTSSYPSPPSDASKLARWEADLDTSLTQALPVLLDIKRRLANVLNIMPASGIMAGIWSMRDMSSGVWNAPANMSLDMVVSPLVKLTDDQQGGFNMPLNGQAINVLRQFPGRGTVVWGARTLDGNSADWRYIQVRRTTIFIEQSIKQALAAFVFAPNTAQTWVTVASMIERFLRDLWAAGGLMGSSPHEAFNVQIGLGSTMTAADILEGVMIVQITLQMIHPAEYVVLTFRQEMLGSA